MHLQRKLPVAAAALICLMSNTPVQPAQAQDQMLQDRLVGTWVLDTIQAVTWDEDDRNPFGPAPRGRMILDRSGHVTVVIVGAERARFLAGDRLTGTAAENQSVVQSTQAFFGTYSVNENDRTVVFHVERSLFPNWDGTDQKINATLSRDELHQVKAGPHASTGYAIWKRAPDAQVAQQY
jgi:hypothetical protein